MRSPTVLVLAGILSLAVTLPAFASEQLLCRPVKQPKESSATPAFRPYTRLRVRDRMMPSGRTVDVKKPAWACFPAGADGASVPEDATAYAGYRTHPSRTKPAQPRLDPMTVDVETPWGTESLRMTGVDDLMAPAVPAPSAGDPGPAGGHDDLACYEARSRRKPVTRTVTLAGDGAPTAVEVSRPLRLCVAADLGGDDPAAPGKRAGWLCLAARLPRKARRATDDPWQGDTMVFRDRFGRTALTLGAPAELCVGVTMGAPVEAATPTPTATTGGTPTPAATPTALPTPADAALVSIRVEPPHVVRKPGQSYTYVAIGTYSDGSQRNVTEEVEWTCPSAPCSAPNESGDRGRVVALDPPPSWPASFDFMAYVSAVDHEAMVASDPVRFEITNDPVPLLIDPEYTIIRDHTFDYLTALGLDEGGAYRNVTQDVVWSSSDPAVAVAGNVVGIRSRIDGVGPGLAEIRATDPATGAVSAPATFDVFGPLVGIEVRLRGRTIAQRGDTLEVGEAVRIDAWAHFGRGFPFEGFEPLSFTVRNPALATVEPVPGATPNGIPNGTLARVIRGTAAGLTRVSARDERTGFDSRTGGCDLRLIVREPATKLRLSPSARSVGLDELVKLTALGVGSDGVTRNWTQRVHYESSNPAVAYTTNEDGDRSTIVVVAPGTTVISAVDPVSGLATTASGGNTTITVRNERADRIDLSPRELHVPRDTFPRFSAIAHYPSGRTSPINESVTWSSSDPEVGRFDWIPDRRRVVAWGEGTATITATMPSTGLSTANGGTNGTLIVEPAVGLTVQPAAATVPVDGEQAVSVKIALASGAEIEVGKDSGLGAGGVALSTSDRTIARDAFSCGGYDWIDVGAPVLGVAPGSATISARIGYPPVTSTATGGDAIITVTAP